MVGAWREKALEQPDDAERVKRMIKEFHGGEISDPDIETLDPGALRKLSRREFESLEAKLYSEIPVLIPLSRTKRQRRKDDQLLLAMSTTARLCTELQLDGEYESLARKLEVVVSLNKCFEIYYNAACFHSLALEADHPEAIEPALKFFHCAIEAAGGELSIRWATKDPDLKEMFEVRPGLKAALEGGRMTMAEQAWARRLTWVLVRDIGEKRTKAWNDRQDTAASWSGLQFAELRKWAKEEESVWHGSSSSGGDHKTSGGKPRSGRRLPARTKSSRRSPCPIRRAGRLTRRSTGLGRTSPPAPLSSRKHGIA